MKKLSACLLVAGLVAGPAFGPMTDSIVTIGSVALADGSPWLPEDGAVTLSAELTRGSTDQFILGDNSTIDLGSDLEGTFLWLNASYGYDDVWAFDFRTGYAQSSLESNPRELDQEDITDTSLGVSYQLINEFEAENGLPTIAVRGGFTFGGDYDPNVIDALGSAASGIDLSLLVGKSFGSQFALSGDLTFNQRDNDVADIAKLQVTAFYNPPVEGLGLSLGAGAIRTDSDINLGSNGVAFEQLSQTDRDSDWLIFAVNYSFPFGFGVGASFSNLLDGRNVADSNVGTLSVNYSF